MHSSGWTYHWRCAKETDTTTVCAATGVLSDRIGKRSILVIAGVVQIWCPFVQAYTQSFTVAILVACYCGLTGGLFGGPINALQADVLPADENGKSPTACV
jgi:MFS family permease